MIDQQLRFTEFAELREPREGEIVVDVLQAGICETDLQLCRGYMGFQGIPGHEFVGIARGGRFAGQRVVGEINCACNKCSACLRGMRNHCPNRTVIGILNHDGAFADRLLVPEENLLLVPETLTTDQAVFVEPLAAACRIPQQIPVSGRQAVVLGAGRLGNLCAQVLAHHGCEVTVIGRHEEKLRLLADRGIAVTRLDEMTPERTADVVVDCTGSPTGFPLALQLVRPCGAVVLKTTVADSQTMQMAPVVIDEVQVIGSRCGPFDIALQLLSGGHVDVAPLLSARYPLEDAVVAFEHARRKDTLKVLLDIA